MGQKFLNYTKTRQNHWNQVAIQRDSWKTPRVNYHIRLNSFIQNIIPKNSRVLEIGSGQGQLLASLEPSLGVGVDFSHEMIKKAQNKYPNLHFITADAHFLPLNHKFDYVIISDLLNDVWDIQRILEGLHQVITPETRIIVNFFSRVWQPVLTIARKLKLATPLLEQNWITLEDFRSLAKITDYEIVQNWREILWPLPIFSQLFNRFIVKLWPFNHLALTNVLVIRPTGKRWQGIKPPTVSVIVPARNEAENIEPIFQRIPKMGKETELIFVEGHSTDSTFEKIEKTIKKYTHINAKVYQQTGKGKGDAVRLGFAQASGDIFMILDADMTVPPKDLERFYQAIVQNKGEFINGVRLVYPMEENAMRVLNFLGNKFFTIVFSWLLGQTIRDTLCGTKVLWRSDYEIIAANRSYFGELDPFGDFDLLFGAARRNLKIVEIPIRYREREYGETNIKRWKHGSLLLRMVMLSAKKIKFI